MHDLELKPVPVSRGERWLLIGGTLVLMGAVIWYWFTRPEAWILGGMFIVWLMLVSASLAIVRIASYRRQARARRRIAEEVAVALSGRDRQ